MPTKIELQITTVALGLVLAVLAYSHWRACLISTKCNYYEKPPEQEILPNDPHLIVRAHPIKG